jgi:hypothetical protein
VEAAAAFLASANYSECVALADHVLACGPARDSVRLRLFASDALVRLGRSKAAWLMIDTIDLTSLAEIAPEHVYVCRAVVLLADGRFDDALVEYNAALLQQAGTGRDPYCTLPLCSLTISFRYARSCSWSGCAAAQVLAESERVARVALVATDTAARDGRGVRGAEQRDRCHRYVSNECCGEAGAFLRSSGKKTMLCSN